MPRLRRRTVCISTVTRPPSSTPRRTPPCAAILPPPVAIRTRSASGSRLQQSERRLGAAASVGRSDAETAPGASPAEPQRREPRPEGSRARHEDRDGMRGRAALSPPGSCVMGRTVGRPPEAQIRIRSPAVTGIVQAVSNASMPGSNASNTAVSSSSVNIRYACPSTNTFRFSPMSYPTRRPPLAVK